MKVRGRKHTNWFAVCALVFLFFFIYHPAAFTQIRLDASPRSIDFTKVRVGGRLQDTFQINSIPRSLIVSQIKGAGSPFSSGLITNQTPAFDSVIFAPKVRGYFKDSVNIKSKDTNIWIHLHGRGVNYEIHDTSIAFIDTRVNDSSELIRIPLVNFGDDSVQVVSASLIGTSDFHITSDSSLPHLVDTNFVDTGIVRGRARDTLYFTALFTPTSLGVQTALVIVHLADGRYVTINIQGTGVKSALNVSSQMIDFGTIIPYASSPNDSVIFDAFYNSGTEEAIIYSLHNTDSTYFSITPVGNTTLPPRSTPFPFAIRFHIKKTGDFFDTIFVANNSRDTFPIVLKAKVRIGAIPLDSTMLISSTCIPQDTFITLHNPFRVGVKIDTLWLEGDTAGVLLPERDSLIFPRVPYLVLPALVEVDSILRIGIRYWLPEDSAEGVQQLKLIMRVPAGGDDLRSFHDTAFITLQRRPLVSLHAVLPPYRPSAGDAPFRLPIHIQSIRLGKGVLDNNTVTFHFANELLKPVGIDRSGSLTESTASNGIPAQPAPIWDEQASTYTVSSVGLHLSSDSSKNTLLFTLLLSASLTNDTAISITPYISYEGNPCANRMLSATIDYANECGDQTIRSMMSSQNPLTLGAVFPDPIRFGESVSVPYFASKDLLVSWKLYDASGALITAADESSIHKGSGSFAIGMKQTAVSGAHYLECTVREPASGDVYHISTKFSAEK